MNTCEFDPMEYAGLPIGMFHCPECGEMVMAGMAHPDYSLLQEGKEDEEYRYPAMHARAITERESDMAEEAVLGEGEAAELQGPYEVDEKMKARIERDFTYHAPKGNQAVRYKYLSDMAKRIAYSIVTNTPPSREQSNALGAIDEMRFWMNAAIARNE